MLINKDIQISKNFSLFELLKTSVNDAEILKLQKNLTQEILNNLEMLVISVLQPARERLGEPIFITSGYRSESLNKRIGGARFSDHVLGLAVDCYAKNSVKLFEILRGFQFSQLIWYEPSPNTITTPQWIHIANNPNRPQKQVLLCRLAKNKEFSDFPDGI